MNTFKRKSFAAAVLAGLCAIASSITMAAAPPIDTAGDVLPHPYHQVQSVQASDPALPPFSVKAIADRVERVAVDDHAASVAVGVTFANAADWAIQRARYAAVQRARFAAYPALNVMQPEALRLVWS